MVRLYSCRSQIVLGFHGCDKTLAEQVVLGNTMLNSSDHDYDWLGNESILWIYYFIFAYYGIISLS